MISRILGAAAVIASLAPSFSFAEVGEGNFSLQSTKDLYERCSSASTRRKIVAEHDVDAERLDHALELSDLVRINGVGPAFAHFLHGLGVRSPGDFNSTDPQAMLERYRNAPAETALPGPELRLEDLEHCRRFSRRYNSSSMSACCRSGIGPPPLPLVDHQFSPSTSKCACGCAQAGHSSGASVPVCR